MEKLCDLRDVTPRHWSLCFLVKSCYVQDAMPCQWSSSDLPQVLRIWESAFYSQAFFTLHCFLLVLMLPWGRQFNIKVSRASCWYSKHSPGPTIRLNHNNPQKRNGRRFYLKVTTGQLMKNLPHTGFELFSQ